VLVCAECAKKLIADNLEVLLALPVEVDLRSWGKNGIRRWSHAHCTKCDWRGHEGQMGMMPTIMHDGEYPAVCPNCGATNVLFSAPVEKDHGKWVCTRGDVVTAARG
jgi:rubrerythrin